MIVMKFGGASVSDAENIKQTCKIIKKYSKKDKVIVVVSAMKGVTDILYEIAENIKQNKLSEALDKLNSLKKLHLNTLNKVTTKSNRVKIKIKLINLFALLEYFIKNLSRKSVTNARIDYIVSFGERLSCRILAGALEETKVVAQDIDASSFMATDDAFGNAIPLYNESNRHIKEVLLPLIEENVVPVVTGFIGFTHDGCTTTLGRGGSDLSASFLANFMNADGVYLWKDVNGFYTADPHKDPSAKLFKTLDYKKAYKLAKNGAKIIYHKAIAPVEEKKIPIFVKSFIKPSTKGTVVGVQK